MDLEKREEITELIKIYVPDFNSYSDEQKENLFSDVFDSLEKYKFNKYSEYFKYEFQNKTEAQRQTFCGSKEYHDWCYNSVENHESISLSKNKYLTYLKAKEFYKRDIIKVESFEDYTEFVRFVNKNKVYIIKPIFGSLGRNVSKITVSENDSIKSLFFQALQYGGCICEEWIKQDEQIAQFNSTSVNTIRVVTFFDNDKLYDVYAMFRTGRNNCPVDNASQGGIAAGINMENGMVFSDGYTKKNEHFICHPDSHLVYKGFQIPKWPEVLHMIESLYTKFSDFKIIGWDLALSKDGWVLVEINNKPNIDTIQMIYNRTYGYGLRSVLEKTIGRYK